MLKRISSFDNTSINYRIEKRSDFFLIFVHGMGGDLAGWKKQFKFFNKKGYSCLALDLRGHGFSERPKDYDDYSLDNFAKDINCIIKKEKIKKFVLVGHCFGAIVIMNYAKLFPKNGEAYIFIDTTPKLPWITKVFFKSNNRLIKIIHKVIDTELIKHKKFEYIDHFKNVPEPNIRLSRIYQEIRMTSFKSWLYTFQKICEFDGRDILKKIKKKVLILHGARDIIAPPNQSKIMNNILKNSVLKIIPKENHIMVTNNPKIINLEIYRFLISLNKK